MRLTQIIWILKIMHLTQIIRILKIMHSMQIIWILKIMHSMQIVWILKIMRSTQIIWILKILQVDSQLTKLHPRFASMKSSDALRDQKKRACNGSNKQETL